MLSFGVEFLQRTVDGAGFFSLILVPYPVLSFGSALRVCFRFLWSAGVCLYGDDPSGVAGVMRIMSNRGCS